MRNNFFDNGNTIKTPFGDYVLTYNKLDSHHYALERVQNCPNNYVYDLYTSFESNNFLRYFTCWEEQQMVSKKKQKQQQANSNNNIQVKGAKKKGMNLTAFLSKKKAQISSQVPTKIQQKSKKDIWTSNLNEAKKQQLIKTKVVYIQLQAFQNMILPESTEQLKNLMAIIYLLSQTVAKQLNIWPLMIPVIANDGSFKFVKKGNNLEEELVRLFQYGMNGRSIQSWGKDMVPIYEMYKINRDVKILGSKIQFDLSAICNCQYEMILVIKSKKMSERIKITQPNQLHLIKSDIKVQISQYNVIFSYIDQNAREVTLQHNIIDQDIIRIIGQSDSFIIRYLKHFRTR